MTLLDLCAQCCLFKVSECVGDAWGQNNRGTTTAAKEFSSTDLSVGRKRTKTSYVAQVECLPRVGPMGDIFLASAHSLEDLLLQHPPSPHKPRSSPHFFFSFLSWQMWGRHWPFFLSFLFPFCVGVEPFLFKCHVFLISAPFAWKRL